VQQPDRVRPCAAAWAEVAEPTSTIRRSAERLRPTAPLSPGFYVWTPDTPEKASSAGRRPSPLHVLRLRHLPQIPRPGDVKVKDE